MYLWGCIVMGVFLLVIGGVSLDNSSTASWTVGAMLLAWNVIYQFSVSIVAAPLISGPVFVINPAFLSAADKPQVGTIAFSLVTELSSRRLMVKSLNIGRALYNVEGLVIGSLNPYMLSEFVPGFCSGRKHTLT